MTLIIRSKGNFLKFLMHIQYMYSSDGSVGTASSRMEQRKRAFIVIPKTIKKAKENYYNYKLLIGIPYNRVSASHIMYNYSKNVVCLLVDHAKLLYVRTL